MVKKRKTIIAVDKTFFDSIFERQRKKLQGELGVMNLSQANFSRMIVGLKLKPLKKDPIKIKKSSKRKRNELFI